MEAMPKWYKDTMSVINQYRIKQKPSVPTSYIDLLQGRAKAVSKECYAFMNTMSALESERIGWIAHFQDMLEIANEEDRGAILAKIDELQSVDFWRTGEGAVLSEKDKHLAYMGKQKANNVPAWTD